MQKQWLNNVLSNLCEIRVDIFGCQAVFQEFEPYDSDTGKSSSEGFNSIQLYGRIVYKDDKGSILKSKPVVVKRPLKIWFRKFSIPFSFINEMNFYSKIVPVLSALDDTTFSKLFPKFYHGEIIFTPDGDQSAIILENLTFRGYRMNEKKSFLSYQHLKLMLHKLGQFHAFSYKAKKSTKNLFYPLAINFLETNSQMNKEPLDVMEILGQRGLEYLQRDPAYKRYVPEIKRMLENADDILTRTLTCDKMNPLSVIVHGDYLRNNVMFKYEDNSPKDLVIIDVATFRYGSPVIDLATVLYINADQETRDKYWDLLIDEYYSALKQTLAENEIPSKREILLEFNEKCFYVYLIASGFLPFLVAVDNNEITLSDSVFDINNFTRESCIELGLSTGGEKATKVLGDILKDMIDRGFICESSFFK